LSDCDFVTGGGLEFVVSQMREFFGFVQENGDNLGLLIDGLATLATVIPYFGSITKESIDEITDIVLEVSDELALLFADDDFFIEVQKAWLKSKPAGATLTQITRQDILNVGNYLPLV